MNFKRVVVLSSSQPPLSPHSSRNRGGSGQRAFQKPFPSANDELTGTVSSIKPYGVFIDIGDGLTGLVHISEIAGQYISSIEDHIKLGETVNVRVLKTDRSGKISLSIRQSIASQSKGYARVVELGGDWGHPWNDDGATEFVKFSSVPPPGPQHWEPDLTLFDPFDEDDADKPSSDTPPVADSQQ